MIKRAYHQLILPEGQIHRMVVVCFDEKGRYISHHNLQGEEPFVEWRGGTLDLCQENTFLSPMHAEKAENDKKNV